MKYLVSLGFRGGLKGRFPEVIVRGRNFNISKRGRIGQVSFGTLSMSAFGLGLKEGLIVLSMFNDIELKFRVVIACGFRRFH